MIAKVDAANDQAKKAVDYTHTGKFKEAEFIAEATRRFRADPMVATRFNGECVPGMRYLLGRLSADGRVTDIRWIAYMLATAFWEGAELLSVARAATKALPKPKPRRAWRAMAPAREMGEGKGKKYYLKVKVLKLPDGRAEVTEQDGDRWVIGLDGRSAPLTKNVDLGAPAAGPPRASYVNAKGSEFAYYGRGFVQITWWANYASNGAEIGLGLNLLFNPDKTLEPDIAYKIMVDGMVDGKGFANRRRLQDYLYGVHTDYAGARAIVNKFDPIPSIVRAAQLFEACLLVTKA